MKSWLKIWQLPTPTATGSHAFMRPYGWEEVLIVNARMKQTIDHGRNWNDGDVPYSELETATSRSIICCCNLLLWTAENKLLAVLSTVHFILLS
jgi:hypothetical protein